jgi:hypothetical protein
MWDDICFTTDGKAAGTHLLIATLALIISILTFIAAGILQMCTYYANCSCRRTHTCCLRRRYFVVIPHRLLLINIENFLIRSWIKPSVIPFFAAVPLLRICHNLKARLCKFCLWYVLCSLIVADCLISVVFCQLLG